PQQVREFLGRTLPEYMIPAAIMRLDFMPLSANGKLDRRALPEPEFAASLETRSVSPRTTTEEIISAIWVEVLQLERVGIHDNFFELGGHSLLAMQIASRVAQTFGVEIALKTILGSPTIAELSRAVDTAQEGDSGIREEPMKALPHDSPLPL